MNIIKALSLLILLIVSVPASAQGYICGLTEKIKNELEIKFKERMEGWGIVRESTVRLYVNSQTRAFSIIIVYPSGGTCIVLAGEDWEFTFQETSHEDEDPISVPD